MTKFDISRHDVVNKQVKAEIHLRYIKKWGLPFNTKLI